MMVVMKQNITGTTRSDIITKELRSLCRSVRQHLAKTNTYMANGNTIKATNMLTLAQATLEVAGRLAEDDTVVWSDGHTAYLAARDNKPPTLAWVVGGVALTNAKVIHDYLPVNTPAGMGSLEAMVRCVDDLEDVVEGRSAFRRMT